MMTQNEACQQILDLISEYQADNKDLHGLSAETSCVALARIGTPSQKLLFKPLKELCKHNIGKPMHSLIIPAKLSVIDEEHVRCLCD